MEEFLAAIRINMIAIQVGQYFYVVLNNQVHLSVTCTYSMGPDGQLHPIKMIGIMPDGTVVCSQPDEPPSPTLNRLQEVMEKTYSCSIDDVTFVSPLGSL